jgi:hypothetical protein
MNRKIMLAALAAVTAAGFVAGTEGEALAKKKKKPFISFKSEHSNFKSGTSVGVEPAAVGHDAITGLTNFVGASIKVKIRGFNSTTENKLVSIIGDMDGLFDPATVFPLERTFTISYGGGKTGTAPGSVNSTFAYGGPVTVRVTGVKDGFVSATFMGTATDNESTPSTINITGGKIFCAQTIEE